jgi:two-component system nitrogen regulation response regulator GlnG
VNDVVPLIFVVDDDESIRWVLERALKGAGWRTALFESAEAVIEGVRRGPPAAILTDIRMPGQSGIDLLRVLSEVAPEIPVIVMTAHTDLDSAVSAYREGAFEYLPKPFDIDEAIALVDRALQSRHESAVSTAEPEILGTDIVGEAPAMQEVFRVVGRLANSDMSVLIRGESGTGKELVARAIFNNSPRASQPFIAINTAAIPAELLESELFGHEKGAFTGAQSQRLGRFEQANGGTLFLDEIGDMPSALQTRLLRVLADGTFYRVGGHEQLRVDVRIIAATNQDLDARVRDGRFREDLFHRLDVIGISLPPLRERREDIPVLARRFMDTAAEELQVESKHLPEGVLNALAQHDWPGNVRQLENLCRRLTVMAPGQNIALSDLPPEFRTDHSAGDTAKASEWQRALEQMVARRLSLGETAVLDEIEPDFERILIRTALAHTGGRKQEAAKCLGWGRNTLTRKLRELGLE